MYVHVVAKAGDRILPRLARTLVAETQWTVSLTQEPTADIVYFMPYYLYNPSMVLPGQKTAALFTHIPNMRARFFRVAAQIDLRLTWARQYVDRLSGYGPTAKVTPALNLDAIRHRGEDRRSVVGVSGYVSGRGRKNPEMVAALADEFAIEAVGRGWPVPTMTRFSSGGVIPWYSSIRVLLCPSRVEGVPYPPLEALACDTSVVLPRGVGILDEFGERPGVRHYAMGDVADARRAIRLALADGQQGLRHLVEHMTPERNRNEHVAAFESL